MTEKHYAVAIDGPSGAGKSTLARAAAEALHILYVDTGAIYRTIGVYMYRHDIQPTDAAAVTAALPEITVSLRYDEDGLQRMYLNGEDVTKEIRLPAISRYASDVSAIPAVRDYLFLSHDSYEVGYRLAAERLGLEPCLHLGMRLGEGSGCPLLFRVMEGACGVMSGMATFAEAAIHDGYLDEIRAQDSFTVDRP